MKASIVSTGAAALFVWGYIFGSGTLAPDHHSSQVIIPKSTNTATEIPLATTTSTIAVAEVLLIPSTPEPVYQVVVIDPVQQVVTDQPIAAIEIVTESDVVPTSDLSQWVIPLDPAQQPGMASPYEAGPGQTANVVPPAVSADYASMTLDQAWDTAVAMGLDDRFPSCSYPLPMPFIDWPMAVELSQAQTADREYTEIRMQAADIAAIAGRGGAYFPTTGIVQISEDVIPSMLLQLYGSGAVAVCSDGNNKPNGYGPGVQFFLDQLAGSYLTKGVSQ